jgi:hypothetical protein
MRHRPPGADARGTFSSLAAICRPPAVDGQAMFRSRCHEEHLRLASRLIEIVEK